MACPGGERIRLQKQEFKRLGKWNPHPAQPYLEAKRAVLTNGSAIT